MKILKRSCLFAVLLCSTAIVAQTTKAKKTYKTDAEVRIDVDASHTNVIVEPWNQNEVQVEAVLDLSGVPQEEREQALKQWKLDLSGDAQEVTIRSTGGGIGSFNMAALEVPLSRLPEMMAPLQQIMAPLLESISNNPLPPEFHQRMGKVKFDYEAYKENGEEYLEQFEEEMEKNFGKDFEKSMEQWAQQLDKNADISEEQAEAMEKMGEQMEKDMEAWGEQFGKQMEAWGEQFGEDMEAWADKMEATAPHSPGALKKRTNKSITIKVPKNARLMLNVRHGLIEFQGAVQNLQGSLSHGGLEAEQISGAETNFSVAYSPVDIKRWDRGVLNASYVQDLKLGKVRSIKLTSNSSEVAIDDLEEIGIFRGTFGELTINEVGKDFESLDIVLENSDLVLDLPEVPFSFSYTGNRSEVQLPDALTLKETNAYDTRKLKGYLKNRNAEASVSINASFSDVVVK